MFQLSFHKELFELLKRGGTGWAKGLFSKPWEHGNLFPHKSPPTFFGISDPTKEVDTTGNWLGSFSLYKLRSSDKSDASQGKDLPWLLTEDVVWHKVHEKTWHHGYLQMFWMSYFPFIGFLFRYPGRYLNFSVDFSVKLGDFSMKARQFFYHTSFTTAIILKTVVFRTDTDAMDCSST